EASEGAEAAAEDAEVPLAATLASCVPFAAGETTMDVPAAVPSLSTWSLDSTAAVKGFTKLDRFEPFGRAAAGGAAASAAAEEGRVSFGLLSVTGAPFAVTAAAAEVASPLSGRGDEDFASARGEAGVLDLRGEVGRLFLPMRGEVGLPTLPPRGEAG